MVSEDRQSKDFKLAESQRHRATQEYGNCSGPKIKFLTIQIPKFGGQIVEFKHLNDTKVERWVP